MGVGACLRVYHATLRGCEAAWGFIFDTGFRVGYRSGGFMTDYEKEAMSTMGRVDVTRSDDSLMTFYGDRKSIKPHKGALRVRLLFDYAQLQQDPDTLIEHRSTVEVASVNCRDRRLAAIEATSYAKNMGRGAAVVVNERVPDPGLRYVKATPGSIDDEVVTFVCKISRSIAFRQAKQQCRF